MQPSPSPATYVWLTRAEAAEHARASVRTIDRWIRAGRVPVHRVGRSIRIDRAALDALITSGGAVR
ncbi:helix-turn-helix domain-containing protein [Micrococcus luteus]|nr:helix-turn-helix domain-containing protein [Micrococcus luteus]